MHIKNSVLQALRLNKHCMMGKPINYKEGSDSWYDSYINTIELKILMPRMLVHEGAHATLDIYFHNDTAPYFPSDGEDKKEFSLAANQTMSNVFHFLEEKNILDSTPDISDGYNTALFELKKHPVILSLLLNSVLIKGAWSYSPKFFDFWQRNDMSYKTINSFDPIKMKENIFYDACEKYVYALSYPHDQEDLPFSNACDVSLDLSCYLGLPLTYQTNPFYLSQTPQQLITPLIKKVVDKIGLESLPENISEFIIQIAHLMFYPVSQYDDELAARIFEFSDLSPEISSVIKPLEGYFQKFAQQISESYTEHFGENTALDAQEVMHEMFNEHYDCANM